MNDILPIIKERRSVRSYLPKMPDWENITRVVEAGRHAPSCGNIQDWSFVVCYEKGIKDAIANACLEQYWMVEAPVHIIVCAQPSKSERYYGLRGERLYSVQNCAAAAMCMILEAQSLGMSTCWIGAFEEEAVKRIIKAEEFVRPQIILTLGYAAEQPAKPPKFPLEHLMHLNKWGAHTKNRAKAVNAYSGYWKEGYDKIKDAVNKGKTEVGKRLGV